MDNLIEARELQIERKHFHVEFRENDRGISRDVLVAGVARSDSNVC